MNITDRAQKVLSEIDAELALAEKATPGPWFVTKQGGVASDVIGDGWRVISGPTQNADFIAASRTGWPTSLRCLKTAIEGYLRQYQHKKDEPCYVRDAAENMLTTLCDQWEAKP